MRVLRVISAAALVAILAVSACTPRDQRVLFDGKYYPSKSKLVDKGDRQQFVTTVHRAAQGLAGAREAGRYGGTRYCLKNFGTSRIEWTNGPDAEETALNVSNGNLVLKGRCVTW